MLKAFLLVLCLSSLVYGSVRYTEQASNVLVEDVHYDAELSEIVVHAHAQFMFFSVNKIYGIKVKDSKDAAAIVDRMIGSSPAISELK